MCHFLPVHHLGIVFLGRVEGQNITLIIHIKMDLALNNLPRLICHETQPPIQIFSHECIYWLLIYLMITHLLIINFILCWCEIYFLCFAYLLCNMRLISQIWSVLWELLFHCFRWQFLTCRNYLISKLLRSSYQMTFCPVIASQTTSGSSHII